MIKNITLRLRVLNTWNGRICLFSLSQATDSQSRIQLVTLSFRVFLKRAIISGYLEVLFS